MNNLRKFCAASVLIVAFTTPALAGVISTTVVPPDSPPASETTGGDMTTGVAGNITTMNADAEAAGGSVTDAALALIQSVLSLF